MFWYGILRASTTTAVNLMDIRVPPCYMVWCTQLWELWEYILDNIYFQLDWSDIAIVSYKQLILCRGLQRHLRNGKQHTSSSFDDGYVASDNEIFDRYDLCRPLRSLCNLLTFYAASGLVCVMYDHALTLNDEIWYIWFKGQWNIVKISFLINRYTVEGSLIYTAYGKL